MSADVIPMPPKEYNLGDLIHELKYKLQWTMEDLQNQHGSKTGIQKIIDGIEEAYAKLDDVEDDLDNLHAPLMLTETD